MVLLKSFEQETAASCLSLLGQFLPCCARGVLACSLNPVGQNPVHFFPKKDTCFPCLLLHVLPGLAQLQTIFGSRVE